MTDSTDQSTPLLTNSASNLNPENSQADGSIEEITEPAASNLKPEDSKPDESIEEMIEPYLRGLTWRRVLQALLGFLPSFFVAEQTFISIFTDTRPTWHCTELGKTICNADSNICELPEGSWSWDKPAYTSIVSEWSLQCASSSIIEGLPASSFFTGCLIAGLVLFFIGDSFGRKNMLFVSSLVMSISSFLTAFSNNVWIYSALRFVSGSGRAAIGTCALVLATESIEKKWRSKVGSVGFFFFTSGCLALPGIAYCVRSQSWRVMYFLISIPALVFSIVFQLFAYESPKWLLVQGREQEAVAVLKAFAGAESEDLSWNFPALSAYQDQKLKGNRKVPFLRILMESRALCRNFFVLVAIQFGIGLVFYGTSLRVGNLGLDIYWGAAFNASLQLVSFFIVYFTVNKLKRRISILALAIISGVCCILLVSKIRILEVAMELVAFFGAATSFSYALIYTAELFPTRARNSAVAIVWQALILAGVVSPVLTVAGGSGNFLPYAIIGVLSIVTGILVVFLPETVGATNPADDANREQAERDRSAA